MARNKNIQRADLDDLLRRRKKVYVMNSSQREDDTLVILHNPANGQEVGEQVPGQRVPWCLSDTHSRKSIGESADLRTHISKGTLAVLDPGWAKSQLAKPRVQRVIKAIRLHKSAGETTPIHDDAPTGDMVNPRLMSVMNALKSGPRNTAAQRKSIDQLELLADSLRPNELAYILQESGGIFPMVNEWALEEMQRSNDDDFDGVAVDSTGKVGRVKSRSRAVIDKPKALRRARKPAENRSSGDGGDSRLSRKQKDSLLAIRDRLLG